MIAKLKRGWIQIAYDGPELATVSIMVGPVIAPAFLDYDPDDGTRIAKIKAPYQLYGNQRVGIVINGRDYPAGRVRLPAPVPARAE